MRGGRIKKIIYTHIINIYRRRRRRHRFRGLRNENYWFFLHYYYYDYFIFSVTTARLGLVAPGPWQRQCYRVEIILYTLLYLVSVLGFYMHIFIRIHVYTCLAVLSTISCV